jgi:hypothetical protein
MKKLIFTFLLAVFSTGLFSNPIVAADTIRIEGKLTLWLMVEGYEAGWNYGYLLGDRIVNLMENYLITSAFGGASNYLMARQIFDEKFIYDQKYANIAQGMIDGIDDSGVSIFSPTLGEELTFKDVLIANSVPDFTSIGLLQHEGPGCSDLMSWGEATINDPMLNGELVISRNLDWTTNSLLVENSLMIIWGSPSGEHQRIITFGFAGLIGALSGFNESGIVSFQNMGNHNMQASGSNFYPVNLAQRNGLESWDYNSDGVCSPRDVTDAVREHNVSSTFIINTAGYATHEPAAEILEIHNSFGEYIRTFEDNLYELGTNLASTNHFRKLRPPAYCYRYDRFVDSLQNSNLVNIQRNWNIIKTAGVSTNLQTIQFVPYLNLLRFSFAKPGIPAYQIEPTEVMVDTLFSIVSINERINEQQQFVNIFPNPAKSYTKISIISPADGNAKINIFDFSGRNISTIESNVTKSTETLIEWGSDGLNAGIYFCEVTLYSIEKKAALSQTVKIVISK